MVLKMLECFLIGLILNVIDITCQLEKVPYLFYLGTAGLLRFFFGSLLAILIWRRQCR